VRHQPFMAGTVAGVAMAEAATAAGIVVDMGVDIVAATVEEVVEAAFLFTTAITTPMILATG
jgi:hypothetical protein